MIDMLPAADCEYVAKIQREHDRTLRNQLQKVQRTGTHTTKVIELLEINQLIEFGGPSQDNPYNHHRLTPTGKSLLAHFEARYGKRG